MRLELELNKPSIYYPGQRITGVVNIIMQVPGKIRILRLRFIGCEETSWYHVNASSKDDAVDLASFSSEIFLNDEQYYIGEKNNEADFEIPTGVTSIFFNYKLPKSLPSSYKGVHGHIEYKVEAHIQTNLGFRDRKAFFDVKGIYNLTQHTLTVLFSPKEENMAIETVNLFCKSNGNVEVFFYLSKVAYAPGEKIPFYSKITNNSKFSVNVHINLVRYVTYNIKGSPKQEGEFRIFTFRKSDKVKSGKEDSFESDSNSFRVPKDCVPTNLGRREGAGLISVKYNVELSLKVSSYFQNSLVIPIPIYIGGVAKRIIPEKEDNSSESGKSLAEVGSEMSIHSTKTVSTIGNIASSISKVFKRKKSRKKSEGELTSQDKIFPSTKSSKSSRKSKTNKSYNTTIESTSLETVPQDKITTKSKSDNESESDKTTNITTTENEPDKITANLDIDTESETDKIPNNSESE